MLTTVNTDRNLLNAVITTDKSWVYGHALCRNRISILKISAYNIYGAQKDELNQQQFKTVRPSFLISEARFITITLHTILFPPKSVSTKGYYQELQRRLYNPVKGKRVDQWKNNSPSMTNPLIFQTFIVGPWSPCFPSFTPCDFLLFLSRKVVWKDQISEQSRHYTECDRQSASNTKSRCQSLVPTVIEQKNIRRREQCFEGDLLLKKKYRAILLI